jgi:RNA polymerase sigma factor (sigma-70 family)
MLSSTVRSCALLIGGARPDDDLVHRARAGDRSAITKLIAWISPQLQRWLRRTAQRLPARFRHEEEDLYQTILHQMLKSWPRFQCREPVLTNFRGWAFQVAKNQVDRWLAMHLRPGRDFRREEAPGQAVAGGPREPSAPQDDDPCAHLLRKEQAELLARAMRTLLTPSQREALVLRYGERLSVKETAIRLRCTPHQVTKWCERGKARLRQFLNGPA